jgi:hypothetical protein
LIGEISGRDGLTRDCNRDWAISKQLNGAGGRQGTDYRNEVGCGLVQWHAKMLRATFGYFFLQSNRGIEKQDSLKHSSVIDLES